MLAWLRPHVPPAARGALAAAATAAAAARGAAPLAPALAAWLGDPADAGAGAGAAHPRLADACGACAACASLGLEAGAAPGPLPPPSPPLRHVTQLHAALGASLASFADDAAAAAAASTPLDPLRARLRFLRSLLAFHAASEDDVLLPVLRDLQREDGGVGAAAHACDADHPSPCDHHQHAGGEAAALATVGRLLADATASARRGGRDAGDLGEAVAAAARRAADHLSAHMAAEEATVLPPLLTRLCAGSQRALLWRTLRAMPARVLRRLWPWLANARGGAAVVALLADAAPAAPPSQAAELGLLRAWAEEAVAGGEAAAPRPRPPPPPRAAKKARPAAPPAAPPTTGGDNPIDHIFQFHKALRRDLRAMEGEAAAFSAALDAAGGSGWAPDPEAAAAKEGDGEVSRRHTPPPPPAAGAPPADSTPPRAPPPGARADARAARRLEGRFHFLQGVYKAHSDAEDTVVFPALEAKEALRRVSHAYALDHRQEEEMFRHAASVLARLRGATSLTVARAAARELATTTAALRASLETHVTAEERELWPLFAENFTADEQEALVGTIVGRTGAEVLAATLPWVAAATTPAEGAAMLESLRAAARGTAFDEWLATAVGPAVVVGGAEEPAGAATTGAAAAAAASSHPCPAGPDRPARPGDALDAVVEYLGLGGGDDDDAGCAGACSAAPSSTTRRFRPGWDAIFRMNQAQLEAAVRTAAADASLEPARRAYLAQHIMAARFVVAQQRARAAEEVKEEEEEECAEAGAGAGGGEAPGAPVTPPPPPCPHYRRATRVVAPCCGKVVGCRHCHDEGADHALTSGAVSAMVCGACARPGPAGAHCAHCSARQARYYCAICRLWDDTPGRQVYHCPFCNLCRLGAGLGVDAQHCMRCNSCMSLEEHATHACRPPAACPVCGDRLFDSAAPYRALPCGHHMHSHCFRAWATHSYTCPVCRRSAGDMRAYFGMLDALLARDEGTLPAELAARTQAVACDDCGGTGDAPFHFVYHKCGGCGSYNTRLL